MRPKKKRKGDEYEFRAVTAEDLKRERIVEDFIARHLAGWQNQGWVPDVVIEPGDKTDESIRTRGWTHWHQLFNPRQLLVAGLARKSLRAQLVAGFLQSLNWNSRISHWSPLDGGGGSVKQVFYNQALNTFFSYGCRASTYLESFYRANYFHFPIRVGSHITDVILASNLESVTDLSSPTHPTATR
ncbi:MAG: hypothetical protein ACREYE_19260 [Gammaproteobacteria bacterium]